MSWQHSWISDSKLADERPSSSLVPSHTSAEDRGQETRHNDNTQGQSTEGGYNGENSGTSSVSVQENIFEARRRSWRLEFLCPICVGGTIFDADSGENYAVWQKLGEGLISTIWLVRNCDPNKCEWWGMKVFRGFKVDFDDNKQLIVQQMIHHPQANESSTPRSGWVQMGRRAFKIRGPKGPNICLLFPVLILGIMLDSFREITTCVGLNGECIQHGHPLKWYHVAAARNIE